LTSVIRKIYMNLLRFNRLSGATKRFCCIILCEPFLMVFSFIRPPPTQKGPPKSIGSPSR
jgi:hypothetical protein